MCDPITFFTIAATTLQTAATIKSTKQAAAARTAAGALAQKTADETKSAQDEITRAARKVDYSGRRVGGASDVGSGAALGLFSPRSFFAG